MEPDFLRSRFRGALVWLIALKIAGLLLVIDPWAIQSSDLPKTIFSRAAAWLMAGMIAALLLRHGSSAIPRSPVHLAVLGLLTANVLSAIVAENKLLAVYGDFPRFLGLGFLADMSVLYFAVAITMRTQRDWGIVAAAALGAFLVAAAYAGVQSAGLDPIRWTDDPESRPFSTYGGPDQYGHLLSVFIGAGLGLAALGRHRVWCVLAAACVVIALSTAGVVATRGTLVGLAFAVLAVIVLVTVSRGPRGLLAGVAIVAAAVLTASVVVPESPLAARAAATALSGAEVKGRLALYDVSRIAWRERPLLGYGVDNFGPAFVANHTPAHYDALGSGVRETSAHSWPLQAAVTTGTLGLAALIAMIVVSAVALLRALPAAPAIAGTLLVGSAAYWAHAAVSVGAVGVDWFAWLTWGSAAALAPAVDVRSRHGWRLSRSARVVSLAVLPLVLAAAMLTAVPSLRASHEAWEARDAVRGRDGFRAIAAASAAAAREPLRADHWNWLGLAYDIHARWEDEAEAFTRAAALAPQEIQYRVNAARAYGRLAAQSRSTVDLERSRAALAMARAVDPNNPLSYQVQAEVELAAGRYEAALGQALVAYGLDPRGDLVFLARRIALAAPPSETPLLMVTDALRRRETASLQVLGAELALKLGRRETARAHASRALQLEPGRADAQRILDQTR